MLSLLGNIDVAWTLIPLSVAFGIITLWIFGRLSDQKAIRQTRNRLKTNLLEIRLFGGEPALLFQAQKNLLLGNIRLLVLTLKPALILAIPLWFLVMCLDPYYGRCPLPVGQAALVTVHYRGTINPSEPPPTLNVPIGVTIEASAVRVLKKSEISWRIRPNRDIQGKLWISFPGETIVKTIVAGSGHRYAADRRVSSWPRWILHPGELPTSSSTIDWIELKYPQADVRLLGLKLHWLLWLMLISTTTALLLKGRMRISL